MSNVRCLMFLGSPHFTIDSVDVALGSAAISLISLGVATVLAWKTKLSPASLVGTMPYAIVWTFFEQTTGKPSGYFLVPTFWLSNSGARAALVEDMRLTVRTADGLPLTLYPVHSVPLEAIESPTTFKECSSSVHVCRLGALRRAPARGSLLGHCQLAREGAARRAERAGFLALLGFPRSGALRPNELPRVASGCAPRSA